MPIVSIIIPIYNVQEYLIGCLQSVCNQTFKDVEIICVDDGSTDESGSLLESYAQQDKRIRIVHQKNKGSSSARNIGLDLARGKYIAFCDSDDYWHPCFLEYLLPFFDKCDADVVTCKLIHTCKKYSSDFKNLSQFKPSVFVSETPMIDFLRISKIQTGVHIKIYRKEALGQLRFVEGICYDDVPFTTMLMLQIKKIVVTNYPMYFYYDNPNSIMRTSFTLDKVESYVKLIRHISTEIKQKAPQYFNDIRKNILNKRFKMMVNQAIRKQTNINSRIILFDSIQKYVKELYDEGLISYAGLKPQHRIALYCLLKCKTSHLARIIMTIF